MIPVPIGPLERSPWKTMRLSSRIATTDVAPMIGALPRGATTTDVVLTVAQIADPIVPRVAVLMEVVVLKVARVVAGATVIAPAVVPMGLAVRSVVDVPVAPAMTVAPSIATSDAPKITAPEVVALKIVALKITAQAIADVAPRGMVQIGEGARVIAIRLIQNIPATRAIKGMTVVLWASIVPARIIVVPTLATVAVKVENTRIETAALVVRKAATSDRATVAELAVVISKGIAVHIPVNLDAVNLAAVNLADVNSDIVTGGIVMVDGVSLVVGTLVRGGGSLLIAATIVVPMVTISADVKAMVPAVRVGDTVDLDDLVLLVTAVDTTYINMVARAARSSVIVKVVAAQVEGNTIMSPFRTVAPPIIRNITLQSTAIAALVITAPMLIIRPNSCSSKQTRIKTAS